MSQTSIESYFPTRKRAAVDEARGKNKVLILDQNQTRTVVQKFHPESPEADVANEKIAKVEQNASTSCTPKQHTVVRNIQFDSPKGKSPKSRKPRTRRVSVEEGQADIRETFQKKANADEAKTSEEEKVVSFEKKGSLTPKKSQHLTPKKDSNLERNVEINENPTTPKKTPNMPSLAQKNINLDQIKCKLMKSKRLHELRARISKISELDEKLSNVRKNKEKKDDDEKPGIKKFDSIELEIPVSPQKQARTMMSPTKNGTAVNNSNLLMSPKKCAPSPIKVSPIKEPAYKRFVNLASKEEFVLPEHYRLLGEIFRSIDTICAMLHNRNETITFTKLKPSVQEMLRRNLSLDHLAQIKFLYPEAFEFRQEKFRHFAQGNKEKYELILKPLVETKNACDKVANDKLKSTFHNVNFMNPNVLLERRRKMYSLLLDKVMDEHEEFLKSVGMEIDRKELTRWHPAFDVNSCKPIEKAELPKPPNVEILRTASEVLDAAKKTFNCNTRMEKALQLLAETNMTSKTSQTSETSITEQNIEVENTSVIDTPPETPKAQSKLSNSMLKGIPKSLLEKVRAKQAAKALEQMTRPAHADKEIVMYSQLPSMAQVLRNIFVSEKKNVLTLEFVLDKLDNSYKTKMTLTDLEKHLKLMSDLIPTWIMLLTVQKVDYVKLLKNVEIATIVKRLELFAKEKIESYRPTRG